MQYNSSQPQERIPTAVWTAGVWI